MPLTTISMDPIPRERMGNATSLFNLMRNLGGSIGIATTGTLLARKQQEYFNVFGTHVDPYSTGRRRTRSSRRARASSPSGADPATAMQRAYAVGRRHGAAAGGDGRRSSTCSGMLGIIFLLLVPLVMLMRRPRTGRPVAAGTLGDRSGSGIRDSGLGHFFGPADAGRWHPGTVWLSPLFRQRA